MANWCETDRAGAPKAQPSGTIKTKSCHRGNVPKLQELRILLRVLLEIVTKSTEDAWWARQPHVQWALFGSLCEFRR
jgi:hypothetical protein